MSEEDREVVVETTTVAPAPPALQSIHAPAVTQPQPVGELAANVPPPTRGGANWEASEQVESSVGTTSAEIDGSPALSGQQPPPSAGYGEVAAQSPSAFTTSELKAASASPPSPTPATDSSAEGLPVPQLARLSIASPLDVLTGIVESPADMSPLNVALARPSSARNETSSTIESRKHTALPDRDGGGLLSPISAGPSLLSSTYSIRNGTGDSGRMLRGARHWTRSDVAPHSPEEGLGKESMVIQCDDDEEDEDVCHGTVSHLLV